MTEPPPRATITSACVGRSPKRELCSASSRVSGFGATSLMVTTGSPQSSPQARSEHRERSVRIGDERVAAASDQLRECVEGAGSEGDLDRIAIAPHSGLPAKPYRVHAHCQIQKFHENYWKWQ